MKRPKRWRIHSQDKDLASKLASKIEQSEILSQLLINRGVKTLQHAFEMVGKAVSIAQFSTEKLNAVLTLINTAIDQKKPILLYGDYDVDGMTSTSIMVKAITLLGGVVRYKIPHRFDQGYGLSMDIVDLVKNENIGLLITLDCGVTNVAEIDALKEQTDVNVVVIDHHQLPDQIPKYDAMLNPKELEEDDPLFHLCTAGIVFKFVEFLALEYERINPKEYIDLAAIGTIADIATLQGENRRIVSEGLIILSKTSHRGLQSLLQRAGFENPFVTARDIGFVIAPRLNAAGRLSSAQYGVELLLSKDQEHAFQISSKLELMNNDRRALDKKMLEECIEMIEADPDFYDHDVLVLGKKGWHAGVIGITASKLVDRYSKPVVIVAIDDDIARGSARSFGDVSIYHILKKCKQFFTKFGGHKQAAGFSLKPENFDAFQAFMFDTAVKEISPEQLYDFLAVDMTINSEDISLDLAEELMLLEPYGMGNEEPLFYSNGFRVVDFKAVGDGTHLKATFVSKKTSKTVDAIGFGLADKISLLYKDDIHLVFSLDINNWKNKKSLQLKLKDIK
ncbi:MAG: single-stranded-DNA-specific exonuclease RecJ [Rickettsiales bacterium]|nr:single-stranded-DNA-specific exonuclease RecJ [Rickettsiales bacterium]